MSKKPKIDHEYHAHKDEMTITLHGYSLSKKSRDATMKKLMDAVERSPDIANDFLARGSGIPGNCEDDFVNVEPS